MSELNIPPGKYFISHSYKDAKVRDQMIEQLPKGVVPYIFPPISVSPLEFVSNTLIGAILACDGLIYLNGGYSHRSFWVAFERDYALRAGKHVYSFNLNNSDSKFKKHDNPPLDLRVFWSSPLEDNQQVGHIQQFMREKRYFNILIPHEKIKELREKNPDIFASSPHEKQVEARRSQIRENLIDETRRRGWPFLKQQKIKELMREFLYSFNKPVGYVVAFWSKHSHQSGFQLDDLRISTQILDEIIRLPIDSEYKDEMINDAQKYSLPKRPILFALLDSTALPHPEPYVQLYGDEERSQINRIDDLIVMLYWLMYRDQYESEL